MPSRSWKFHAGRLFLAGIAVAFAGWMLGYPIVVLSTVLALYGGWHLVNLYRLHQWVLHPDRKVPESAGLWASIFNGLNSMQLSNRSRQERQQSEINKFHNLVNALPDVLLVTSKAGVIIWGSHSASQLLKFEIPEDFGKQLTTLVRDPDFAGWLANPGDSKQPLDMCSPNEEGRWLTVSEAPLQDNQRLLIIRNITGIHNVEQIRRDFVANISHELRTPLTVLRGYLELLDDPPSKEMNETKAKMLSQALQMQALLDDLLELSRLQYDDLQGKDELVDIPSMLKRLKEQASDMSHGDHKISFEIDQHLLLAGVSSDLESAFSNLITNAIKYTPKKGNIAVTWERGKEGPQLLVQDSGIGIPHRDIPRVTERFYRVGSDRARETGGTGLGLSIVKHVLNAHQAQLSITSQLAVGSKITCSFPRNRERLDKAGK